MRQKTVYVRVFVKVHPASRINLRLLVVVVILIIIIIHTLIHILRKILFVVIDDLVEKHEGEAPFLLIQHPSLNLFPPLLCRFYLKWFHLKNCNGLS